MKLLFWIAVILLATTVGSTANTNVYLSPTALAATRDGKTLFIACATANRVLCFDMANRKVSASIAMPDSPSGLAVSSNGARLFVTCAAPESRVCIVDIAKREVVGTIPAGHTAMAPVLSPDGKRLYVCNRFNNDVSVIDLEARKEVERIPVQREPVAADITRDGKFLLVANHLPKGRADVAYVGAVVSVIDLAAGDVVKELQLHSGCSAVNDIKVSPDGKLAVVTHVLARFRRTPSMPYRGWINANAITLIDLERMQIRNLALVDDAGRGAANPWGIAWSGDGNRLLLAHAGVHEISVTDFPMLLEQRPNLALLTTNETDNSFAALQSRAEQSDLQPFLLGSRRRVKLPESDFGPRAICVVGQTAYVANYFSDTLTVIDLSSPEFKRESIRIGPKVEMSSVRKGEFYFHDAGICYENWQSCASCHPGEGRVDGFNWDLLNDGLDNPKNTKSLLLAHQTPPAMSLGVRDSAEAAVRAGIRHILFTQQPEEVAVAIDDYLKSLKPVPSPNLVGGKLSPSAQRGEAVFRRAGCAECHPPPLFTDLKRYDVGTRGGFDKEADQFDTPTLIEVWRTAPYLHDGSAATVREVLTTRNPRGQHGETSSLSRQEMDDLCAYVLSF